MNQETIEVRGIWNALLDLGKLGRVKPGLIAAGENTSYTHEWLAQFLNINFAVFEQALRRLGETNRIKENGSGIEIVNWHKYQSEYDRQKPYRQKKAEPKEIDPDKYITGRYGDSVKR